MSRDIVLLHKHFDAAHLETVKAEMSKLGAPTIRAIWDEGYGVLLAVEGCHRLRACVELGIEPVIEEIEFTPDALVIEDLGLGMQDEMTLGELLVQMQRDYAYGRTVTFSGLQQQTVNA